jgi:hypothetical protein
MTALGEVEGHRMPHDPETDKTDFHDRSPLASAAAAPRRLRLVPLR